MRVCQEFAMNMPRSAETRMDISSCGSTEFRLLSQSNINLIPLKSAGYVIYRPPF
jgi:hypothetical protein